jgi:hypothetical protein
MELAYRLEESDFGEVLGHRSLYQISAQDHHSECLTSNRTAGDSTGLRVYAGSHLIVRFLVQYNELMNGKSIMELGCGIGGVGLLGTTFCSPELLVLTDGSSRTYGILQKNIDLVQEGRGADAFTCLRTPLSWGNDIEIAVAQQLCADNTSSVNLRYDVVLGSELMYYSTSVETLISTVIKLTNHRGLFIHGHIFRKAGQELELIAQLAQHQWVTLEVPCAEYISSHELSQNPSWWTARMLLSGPVEIIAQLQAQHPKWIVFREEVTYPDSADMSDDDDLVEGAGVGNLFG